MAALVRVECGGRHYICQILQGRHAAVIEIKSAGEHYTRVFASDDILALIDEARADINSIPRRDLRLLRMAGHLLDHANTDDDNGAA